MKGCFKKNSLLAPIFLIGGVFVLFFIFASISEAASLIWTQSSWRGHATSTTATYTINQNNWIHYSSATNIATSSQIATSGLISLWHFNGNTNDSFGSNNGTATGSPSYVAGIYSQAISLNGNDAYVSVPSSTSLNLTNNFTVSAWVKKGESDRYQTILDKGNYKLGIDPSNQAYLEIISNDQTARSTGNTISTGRISAEAVYRGNFYMSGWHGVVSRYAGGTSWANAGLPVPGEPPGNGYNRSLAVYDGTMFDFAYLNGNNGNGWKYNGGTSWTQVRTIGGDVFGSVVYEGNLYIISDATVYRYAGGTTWISTKSSFTYTPYYLIVYNGKLYAGTSYGHVYRYDGGTTWTLVASLSGSNSYYVRSMAVYNNYLYAQLGDTDCGIYRYDGSSWTSAGNAGGTACGGYGYGNSMTVFGGKLYVTVNLGGSGGGAHLYRYDGGTTWTDLNLSPWSSADSNTLSVYDGKLHTSSYTDTQSFGNGKSVYSTSDIGDDYTQITANYNGSVLKIYINGQLEATSSFAGLAATNTLPLLIGNSYGSSEAGGWESTGEEIFRGQIDEVRMYNRALTAAEIANNYNAEKYGENNIFLTQTSGAIFHTSDADFSGTNDRTVVFNNSIQIASSSGYYATGTYTSLPINIVNTNFGTASWNITLPATTTVSVKFRTATTSDMAAATPWASCLEYWSGLDLSNAPCVTDGQPYLQYQVSFTTPRSTSTPQFNDISLNYNHYNTSGNLVSSVFDWGSNNSYLKGLGWSESLPAGTNLLASVRTASSSAALSSASWTQINRGDCSIVAGNATCASSSLPAAMKDGVNDRFVQYKIDLSGNGTSTVQASQFSLTGDSGAINIYYSVGQNVSDHKTGTPTITISGGVATFSTAQTATNMGVGDKISYGNAGATTTVYISAKQSNTVWNVITKIGGQPTATTSAAVLKISHAFNSLSAALPSGAGGAKGANYLNTSDLVAGNYVLNIPCYYDSGPDTTVVTINNWTTGESNYIKVYTPNNTATEVNLSQRHSGKWDTSKYRLEVTAEAIFAEVNYVKIDGLQIQITSNGGNREQGIYAYNITGASKLYFSNNIIKGIFSGTITNSCGISNRSNASTIAYIWNNIVYGWNIAGMAGIYSDQGTTYYYNNTVYNNAHGFSQMGGAAVAKNNIAYNNTDNYYDSFSASSTNNLSGPTQSDAPGSNARQAAAVSFINASSSNFHLLATDIGAKDYGADLSADPYLSFSTDIDGQTRTGTWDIGADEYVALTLSSIATSSVYSGQATVTWTTNNPATSTVKYGLTSSYGSATSSNSLDTSHSIKIKNLTPNTTYHFQVSSTDAPGVTATSTDLTFTTGQVYNVYYSVGQNVSDHKTGTPTITISGGVATFSTAQTATNMGVGDKISYGNAGATTTIYISAKQSQTVWNVITRTGAQPAATSTAAVLKISHAFSSLSAALPSGAGGAKGANYLNTTNLVTGNYILNIPCYYDSGPDTTKVTISGWTTGLSNYIKVYTPNNTATEVNQSQRHSGKWDTSKYRLEITTSGEQRAVETTADYVKVDGLQVKVIQGDSNEIGGIGAKKQGVSGGLWVSNNIIWGIMNYTTYGNGIIFHDWTNTSPNYYVYAWNNIIYGFRNAGKTDGQGVYTTSGVTYAYNNTVYGCYSGFVAQGVNFIAKNNLAYNNIVNYNGGSYSSASSTNNLSGSSQSGAPGSNPQNAKVVSFYLVSTSTTANFHLLASDVNAKDHGADLSGDPYLPFSTDIDSQTRTGTWDIGADEFVPLNISAIATSSITASAATITWTTDNLSTSTVQYGLTASYGLASSSNIFASSSHVINLSGLDSNALYHFRVVSTDAFGVTATSSDHTFTTTNGIINIYYSVGQNVNDHKTGSPHLTIANGVATFDVAQTAVNMGVGDKISYGYANATTTVYISAKQSPTVWNVITKTGAQPSVTTTAAVLKISHAFASLNAAVGGATPGAAGASYLNTANLKTGGYILNIPCYYDSGSDSTGVDIGGWTTGASNYIKIYTPNNTSAEVNQSQRHSGKWDSTKYNLNPNAYQPLFVEVGYVRIIGLQIDSSLYSGGANSIRFDNVTTASSSNLVDSSIITSNGNTGSYGILVGGGNAEIRNSIIYSAGEGIRAAWVGNAPTVTIRNVTTVNNSAYGINETNGTVTVKNTYSGGNTTSDYNGTITYTTSASSDSTTRTGVTKNIAYATTSGAYFTNTTAGSQDLHIGASSALKGAGTDLSAYFTNDIDGQTRSAPWDIGADQYYADITPPVISAIATSTLATTATITWMTDENSTSTVKYGLTTGYGPASSSNSLVTSHSITLHNLATSTIYHYQIGSTDSSGNRATSSDHIFTTTAAITYTIGGSISGLTGTVVLQNNGKDNLSRSANGSFTFATATTTGKAYSVTVLTQPSGQTCAVTSGSGTVSGANVTSVSVTCSNNTSHTYYIDYQEGSDTNSGTSTSSPWQHLPGMAGCANNCSSITPAANYNFILKGGVTWPNSVFPITWTWSGSVSGDIYIGVNQNWYTGSSWTRPVFDAQNSTINGTYNDFVRFPSVQYITLDNIEMTDFYFNTASGYYGKVNYVSTGGSSYITLNHLYLHHWTHGSSADDENMMVVLGDSNSPHDVGSSFQNGIIQNSDGNSDSGYAFYAWPTVKNSVIHDMPNALLIDGHGEISGNLVYNITTSFGGTHENFLETTGVDGDGKIYIHDNVFHAGVGEAALLGNPGETDYVWNNIWYDLQENPPGLIQNVDPGIAAYFWNNTIVPRAGTNCLYRGHTGTTSIVVFENNHCITTAATAVASNVWADTLTVDHNVLQTPTAAAAQGYNASEGYVYSPAAANNSTVGAGTNLTGSCSGGTAGLCSDTTYANTRTPLSRPASGAWDAGAYEYATSSDITPPVITLTGTSTTATTATITWTTNENATSTVKYGATSAYGLASSSNVYVSTTHSIKLKNLTANTVYHFRVESTDAAGNRATSSDKIFTTISAVNVYYSVGQNVSDHKTGTPTITISNGVATFSTAQTAANMGVGDKISYGDANATTTVYISAKQSTTVWNVVTKLGGQPTATTSANVLKISHAFNSLSAALPSGAGGAKGANYLNTTDIVAENYVLNIPCYYDSGPDTTAVVVNGWTTGANNYIKVYTPNNTATEANFSQRAAGKWDDNKYNLTVNAFSSFDNHAANIKIIGLQIRSTYAAGNVANVYFETTTNGNEEIADSILRGPTQAVNSNDWVEAIAYDDTVTVKIWNNIIYDFGWGIDGDYQNATVYIYNNTFYGCWDSGINTNIGGGALIVKNNLSYNIGASSGDYNDPISYSVFENNLSHDNTSLNIPLRNKTVLFNNAAGGNFHLAVGDTSARGAGEDLSADAFLPFNIDIDGQARGSSWDIGADEFVPLNISLIATSSVTASAATVTWATDNLSTSTVQYGLATSYGLASSSNIFASSSHVINLSGLDSNSLYHFRVISTDAFGVTATSSDHTFHTSAGADLTPPEISNIATSTTAGTAIITWTTDENATSSVKYGLDLPYTSASSSNIFASSSPSHSIRLTGLTSNTTYHFQIGSTDAFGNRATSSDHTFQTSDITPPNIYDIATSTASTTATITWTTDEAATSTVRYGLSSAYGLASSSNDLVTGHSIRLAGLIANHFYHFQITAADGSGNKATTSDLTFHALDASAPVVDSFSLPAFANSLTISGIIFTAHDDTAVAGYLVSESGAVPSPDNPGWRAAATTTYTFAAEGIYTLYAWAKDDVANISASRSADIDIDLTPPEISAIASSTAQTSADISWSTDELATSSVAYGTSTVYDFISSSNSYASSTHLLTLNGLKPNMVYHFQIGSTDQAGNRASSSDLTFKTKPGADITPPEISGIASSTTPTTATITWTTDEPATSSVAYGTSVNYDLASSSGDLLTEHTLILRNLDSDTPYHFQIGSSDSSHNRATTSDLIFTTKPAPDLTLPIIDLFSIPATSSSVDINGIVFTAHDNIAVTGYLISESPTPPSSSDPNWRASATTTYAFSSAGTHTLYAWAKDAADNISNPASDSVTITLPTYKIGGTLSGLYGTVVLQNNSGDDLTITSNGAFNFLTKLPNGDSYNVTVLSNPLTETCSVTDPTGVVLGGDVSSVIVYCASNLTQPVISNIHSTTTPTTATITWQTDVPATSTINYSVDSSYDLASTSGEMLVEHSLTLRGLDVYTTYNFRISATDESFNTIHSGDLNFKTIDNIPPTIDSFALPATASSLNVSFTSFSASDNAAVTGYFASESSSTPALGISGWSGIAPTHYNFAAAGSHALYIWARDAAGNESAPATSTVVITIPTYTVGGSISGCSGALVLRNNGGDDLSLTGNGSFVFNTALTLSSAYAVTVLTNPSGQACSVTDGTGNISANVSNVLVSCSTNPYCGDGTCNGGETCGSCSADCGVCVSGGGGGITPADNTPPGVPGNFKAATSSGQMIISWTNPFDSDFAGVKLYRKTGTAPSGQSDALANLIYQGKAQSFVDTGASANQFYYYSIYSYDAKPNYSAAKTISAHSPAVIVADTTPPAPVANFWASSSVDHMTLTWTNPDDSDLAGVKIFHKIGSPLTSHNDPLASVIFQGSATNYVDQNLLAQTKYYYSIYAYDSSFNYSTVVTASAVTGSNVAPPFSNSGGVITSLIGLSSAIANQVTSDEAGDLLANAQFVQFTAAEKSIYDRVIALDNRAKPLTAQQRIAIAYFIHIGTPTTHILGAGERGGSVSSFQAAFGYLPVTLADWQDVIKIGNGRWPAMQSAAGVKTARQSFKTIYGRDADMSNTYDSNAVAIMTYGLRPAQRNQTNEKIAIKAYRYFYKHDPVTARAWDAVRAIAYSGAKR